MAALLASPLAERVRGIFPSFANLERQLLIYSWVLIYSWAAPREREIGVENALGSVVAPSNYGAAGATKNVSGAATEAAPAAWHMAIEQPAQTIGLDPDQGPLSFKAPHGPMSAPGSKDDISRHRRDARFGPISDVRSPIRSPRRRGRDWPASISFSSL
jgi:hypothetical protein